MNIFQTITDNFSYVGAVILLLFIFQVSNMLFGITENVGINKDEFSPEKIKAWAFRTITTLLGVAFLTLGTSLIPFVVELTKISIPEDYGEIITLSIIVLSAYKSVVSEARKAFEHFDSIINRK